MFNIWNPFKTSFINPPPSKSKNAPYNNIQVSNIIPQLPCLLSQIISVSTIKTIIKVAGRVCIDCTIRASVMSRRNCRNDRYVMINPLYIKPVVEPMHSYIEYSKDSLVVGYTVESML
jgi:hypothetical protein